MGVKTLDAEEAGARLAITEVLHRYTRAIDRIDIPAVLACWHPGGTDNRPPLFKGPVEDFMVWLEPTLRSFESATHILSNILINRSGNKAGVESYWTANLRIRREGKLYDMVRGGRYIDEFECRDGVWAILHRYAVTDYSRAHEIDEAENTRLTPILLRPGVPKHAPLVPARDKSDLSYEILGF